METKQKLADVEFYKFVCRECKIKHTIEATKKREYMELQCYLDDALTSSGVCRNCGTGNWTVLDKTGYSIWC